MQSKDKFTERVLSFSGAARGGDLLKIAVNEGEAGEFWSTGLGHLGGLLTSRGGALKIGGLRILIRFVSIQ